MSTRLGKLFSTLLAAGERGGVLAIAAPAVHADDSCRSGPGATTPRGGHWYYRLEAGTKRHCWYLGDARSKTAKTARAKPSPPAATPDQPSQTSAAAPLEPAVANARAELRGTTDVRDQAATTLPPSADTISSNAPEQTGAVPPPSEMAPSDNAAATAPSDGAARIVDTSQSVANRWPDPATDTSQQPAPEAAVASRPQLVSERTEAGPAVRVIGAPESEAPSYSVPMLLGGLAGALAFAGFIGFTVVKFGALNAFGQIRRRRPESIWNNVDNGQSPPWQPQNVEVALSSASDPHRRRREIEAQSRDIMEILSRASRGATT